MSCLLLGHRGHRLRRAGRLDPAWAQEQENTFAAFDRALAAGCDGLELDLQPTRDRRIVVRHDLRLGHRRVRDLDFPVLARRLPGLAELGPLLRRYGGRAWLDLEVKAAGCEQELVDLLCRHPLRRGFVVSSFRPALLRRLAALDPSLPLCLNLHQPRPLRLLRRELAAWIAPNQSWCTAGYVRRLRAAGWRVLLWTVNSPRRMRAFAAAGADAICSDDPYALVETLRP